MKFPNTPCFHLLFAFAVFFCEEWPFTHARWPSLSIDYFLNPPTLRSKERPQHPPLVSFNTCSPSVNSFRVQACTTSRVVCSLSPPIDCGHPDGSYCTLLTFVYQYRVRLRADTKSGSFQFLKIIFSLFFSSFISSYKRIIFSPQIPLFSYIIFKEIKPLLVA